MRPLIRVSLFDATSENDFTLLEENGEYFVSFGDRTGTYAEFLRVLYKDEEIPQELLTGDMRANFFTLMKMASDQWHDEMKLDFLNDGTG